MSGPTQVRAVGPADPDAATITEAIMAVAVACTDADGVAPLNEQARLHLKNHGLTGTRVWVCGTPVDGFALLRDGELDLAVAPPARSAGRGTALASAALERLGHVEAWSHGNDPAAARIAARFAIPAARELMIMTRPVSASLPDLPEPVTPPGVHIRTFELDDEDALLAVNTTAFAHHPEQGNMSHADFAERTAEAWFDPEGLFLAVDDSGDLLGFHWTKVHRDQVPPTGEVYVVAVRPDAAGRGLGSLLTAVGLRHLAGTGVGEVILYVEGDNRPALAVYARLGFAITRTEVQYRGTPTV